MITAVITTIAGFARNLSWKGWLAVATVLVILTVFGSFAVKNIIDSFDDNKQVQANNEDRELREKLGDMRSESNTKINAEERQTNEVLAKLPDAKPSDRRIARACNELRNSGHQPLPVECRP